MAEQVDGVYVSLAVFSLSIIMEMFYANEEPGVVKFLGKLVQKLAINVLVFILRMFYK